MTRTCCTSCWIELTSMTAICARAAGANMNTAKAPSNPTRAVIFPTVPSFKNSPSAQTQTSIRSLHHIGLKTCQPMRRVRAVVADQTMHALDLAGATRYHGELGIETLEIELADDAVMTLLDEEHARAGFELLAHELEFTLGKAKTTDVVLGIGVRVRKEDLGGRLLNDRAADCALQHIARALGRQAHDAIQLTPRLGSILRETLESRVRAQAPELIHPAHQPSAVQELAHEVKEI